MTPFGCTAGNRHQMQATQKRYMLLVTEIVKDAELLKHYVCHIIGRSFFDDTFSLLVWSLKLMPGFMLVIRNWLSCIQKSNNILAVDVRLPLVYDILSEKLLQTARHMPLETVDLCQIPVWWCGLQIRLNVLWTLSNIQNCHRSTETNILFEKLSHTPCTRNVTIYIALMAMVVCGN